MCWWACRKIHTILVGPHNKMRHNTSNNIMADSFHVLRNCCWNKGCHFSDVANEKTGFRTIHTLFLHRLPYAHWSEPVTWNGVIPNLQHQSHKDNQNACHNHHCHSWKTPTKNDAEELWMNEWDSIFCPELY